MKAHSLRQVCVNSIQPTCLWERILYPPSKELASRGTVEQGQDGVTEHPPISVLVCVCSSQQAETHGLLRLALKRDATMAVFASLCAFVGQGERCIKEGQ